MAPIAHQFSHPPTTMLPLHRTPRSPYPRGTHPGSNVTIVSEYRGSSGQDDERRKARPRPNWEKQSSSSSSSKNKDTRRRGRPAWLRSPDDTPLRDGNRDRLLGILTERAARTLLYYLSELNPTVYAWFSNYLKSNQIPRDGNWADVSGETFLRGLLAMPVEETNWGQQTGRNPMYDNTRPIGVDPRNLAQRVMEIRTQIAKEWREELAGIGDENVALMRETLFSSFSLGLGDIDGDGGGGGGNDGDGREHPELKGGDGLGDGGRKGGYENMPDDSAAGFDD